VQVMETAQRFPPSSTLQRLEQVVREQGMEGYESGHVT